MNRHLKSYCRPGTTKNSLAFQRYAPKRNPNKFRGDDRNRNLQAPMARVAICDSQSDASDLVNLVLERALVFGCWNLDVPLRASILQRSHAL
jgi:hypothetical protein